MRNDRRRLAVLTAIIVTLVFSLAAGATAGPVVLSANVTCDNQFYFYVSSSPTAQGTLVDSGTDFQVDYPATVNLTSGTWYLQFVGINTGPYSASNPGALLGSFSLSGIGATFSNGTQSLVTNTTDWVVSKNGFGVSTYTPTSYGTNGVGPWGTIAGISSSAQWIWDSNPDYLATDLYFTTTLTVLPEPAAPWFWVGLGIVLFASSATRTRARTRI